MGQPRLDPSALLGVRHAPLDGRVELALRRAGFLSLQDLGPAPDHLGQGPVRHALPVGEAPPAVPPEQLSEAVHVLVELPPEAGLADPGDAHDRDQMGVALLGGGMEELLDQSQLPVPSHEWRFQPGGLQGAAHAGDHPSGFPQPHRLGLPLQLVVAGVLVGDGRVGCPAGGVADQDGAGLGRGLEAGGRVHQVPGHHALSFGTEGDGRLAG